ncbi:MAG: hypothetical protein HOK65_05785 [Crocinitomicaceae bacterium]|jgi:hypothetical protein|nr:hypothetical protein [Crocinitomicaceae bacterium]
MSKLFIHKTILFFSLPLKNSRGMAALMSVIMSLVIIAAIAINFLAESRQKQTGAILNYTSTNAFMIAEAGLRYVERCMVDVGVSWGCPSALQDENDWATNINQNNNILAKSFAEGAFSIYFPGSSSPVNATGSPNDSDNLRVISVGTYKGASRKFQRIISRNCTNSNTSYAATACEDLDIKNDAVIEDNNYSPEDGNGNPSDVCVADPGLVDIAAYTEYFSDTDCDDSCNGSDSECPDFDENNSNHYNSSTKLLQRFKFCEFKIDNIEVRTSVSTTADNNIYVAKKLEIKNNGLLNLSYDSLSPYTNEDTKIIVYKEFKLKDQGEIKVKGTLVIEAANEFKMEDDSKVNASQGESSDVILKGEKDVEIKDDARFYGAVFCDDHFDLKDDAYLEGWVQSNDKLHLKNDSVLNFDPIAGTDVSNTCAASTVPPDWSE